MFKHIPVSEARSASADASERRASQPRSVRLRFGRGGRVLVDRRNSNMRSLKQSDTWDSYLKSSLLGDSDEDDDMEYNQRLVERWKFDSDDYPPNGPDGLDEQDRILIDDYDPR
jgi:enhancer of polycomb-like protein